MKSVLMVGPITAHNTENNETKRERVSEQVWVFSLFVCESCAWSLRSESIDGDAGPPLQPPQQFLPRRLPSRHQQQRRLQPLRRWRPRARHPRPPLLHRPRPVTVRHFRDPRRCSHSSTGRQTPRPLFLLSRHQGMLPSFSPQFLVSSIYLISSPLEISQDSAISSLKEWLADPAIGNNPTLRLVAGLVFLHENDFNEALKHTNAGGTMELYNSSLFFYLFVSF